MNKFNEKHFGKYEITIRTAELDDITNLKMLNHKWNNKNLSSLENGFLSVVYDNDFFTNAVNNADVLVFEHADQKIGGYVLVNMVMKTEHIAHVQSAYANVKPDLQSKRIGYSLQILLDTELQGTYFIVTASKAYQKYFNTKYDILLSTVSKQNQRSVRIHSKLGWNFYEMNNDYLLFEYIL